MTIEFYHVFIVTDRNSLTYEGHEWIWTRGVCYGRSYWWFGEI